jgi:hypothetical protein
MFNCSARASSECNWLFNTVRAMRSLLNETNLTSKCPYCQILLIAYCASRRDSNFELLRVVICYFIAGKFLKTFKLEISILDPKMKGFWGDYYYVRGDSRMKHPKAHPWANPHRFNPFVSLYDLSFRLCMRLINKKMLYFTHMPGRHRTADCNLT